MGGFIVRGVSNDGLRPGTGRKTFGADCLRGLELFVPKFYEELSIRSKYYLKTTLLYIRHLLFLGSMKIQQNPQNCQEMSQFILRWKKLNIFTDHHVI